MAEITKWLRGEGYLGIAIDRFGVDEGEVPQGVADEMAYALGCRVVFEQDVMTGRGMYLAAGSVRDSEIREAIEDAWLAAL